MTGEGCCRDGLVGDEVCELEGRAGGDLWKPLGSREGDHNGLSRKYRV